MPVFAATFTQETAYWVLALAGTAAFIIKVILVLFGGDMDSDLEGGGAEGDAGSSAMFTLFSVQGVLAFFMGTGWMGLACLREFGLGTLSTFLVSIAFGFAMMVFSGFLMMYVYKLNEEVKYDLNTAVGSLAKVYLKIPPAGEGLGQVEVTVSGQQKVMQAKSTGEAIESFKMVTVVGVSDGEVLIVEPAT